MKRGDTMYRVAVCDDCAKDGRQIFQWAEQIFAQRKMEVSLSLFHNPQDLLAQVKTRNRQYDLFLLDILMGETSGIQLAQALRESGSRAKLIYITVSRDYAIYGYKVQANDYLVKPIEKEILDASIGRILDRHDSVLVEADGGMQPVLVSAVQYCEADGHYVKLWLDVQTEPTRVRATLSEMQQKLGERFVRCHKGYVVNLAQVREIRSNAILLRSGMTIPLGRRYRSQMQEEMVRYVEKAVPL